MNRIVLVASLAFLFISSCTTLEQAATTVINTTLDSNSTAKPSLSNQEVIAGLKSALSVGIENAVQLTSVTDGFLKNDLIRIPFPEDAIKAKEMAMQWGLEGQVNNFETTLNRAAEEASKEALPIFKNAIMNMSIQDGFAILKGGEGSATRYLKANSTEALRAAFSPKVKAAISKVKLTDYWEPIASKYNLYASSPLSNAEPVNTDLTDYVTTKAIDGLFVMVEEEENKIRKDPAARTTDLLKRVFGSL